MSSAARSFTPADLQRELQIERAIRRQHEREAANRRRARLAEMYRLERIEHGWEVEEEF